MTMPSPRRVLALIRKESLQILRDPSSIVAAFVLPLLLLFLFGFGFSLDAVRLRIGLAVEQPSPETAWFDASLANSPSFEVSRATDRRAFYAELTAGLLDGIVVVPGDFSQRLARGDTAPIQVITDGTDPNTAALVTGYVQGAWQSWLTQRAQSDGRPTDGLVEVHPRFWFNPELESRRSLVPGSIALIQMMIGSLLTALVVAREWERGTIEALLATPVTVGEFLIGKVVPNFILGMLAMIVSVLAALLVFHIPLRGSVLALFGITGVFLLVALAIGLVVSTAARTQFAATQFAMLVSFLPGFFFSGFVFELASMPAPLRAFSAVVPARYYVDSLQTIFLAGNVPAILVRDLLVLTAMAGLFLALTVRFSKTRLD